jgi:MFS transporter, SP family, arabinose:H+ symporter
VGTCSLFFANWLIAQLFPVGLKYIGAAATFWTLAVLTLPTFLVVWKYLPETRGKVMG